MAIFHSNEQDVHKNMHSAFFKNYVYSALKYTLNHIYNFCWIRLFKINPLISVCFSRPRVTIIFFETKIILIFPLQIVKQVKFVFLVLIFFIVWFLKLRPIVVFIVKELSFKDQKIWLFKATLVKISIVSMPIEIVCGF